MTDAQRNRWTELQRRGWGVAEAALPGTNSVLVQDPQQCLWQIHVCGKMTRTLWYEVQQLQSVGA